MTLLVIFDDLTLLHRRTKILRLRFMSVLDLIESDELSKSSDEDSIPFDLTTMLDVS